MGIIIGSARIDERGKISGGAAGDQKQTGTDDYKGEVSMQNFYVHAKGWFIIRPRNRSYADGIAEAMVRACNNPNIGYDQGQRYGVITNGINSKVKTECDCSSLVRECVKEATGKDTGDFNTANESDKLLATGLFDKILYVSQIQTPVFNGDILVTKTKGHTAIVVGGNQRTSESGYYPKYTGSSSSIITALAAVGEKDTSKANRARIAQVNGIANYAFTAEQNLQMVAMLKNGNLKKTL